MCHACAMAALAALSVLLGPRRPCRPRAAHGTLSHLPGLRRLLQTEDEGQRAMAEEAPSPYTGCGSAVGSEVGPAARGRVLVQHAGAMAAANAGTIVGLALGWSSAAAEVLDGAQGMPVTLDEWSWVVSLFCVGASVGAASVGRLVHSLGRKTVILAVGPVTIVAWALHLWASSVWMLYAGRLLVGAACGAACVATPIFVCEMSEPRIRGALSSYFEILLCVGILVVYVFGKLLPVLWLNVACLAVSVLHILGFMWFPDTPRWFLLRGREEDAKKALLFYRGPHYDVDAELALLKVGVKESAATPAGWKAFGTRAAKKALAITMVLMILQQITGVNAITFYASQLFKETGSFDAYTASIVVAAVEVVSGGVSMFFVDTLGRRALLTFSSVCMAACTGLMGGYFYFKEFLGRDVSSVSWLPIILVCVYMFTFTTGWGAVVWVFLGEIFPDNIKGVATAACAATGWCASFLVTKFYPGVAAELGNYVCYWGFFALGVLSCVFVVLALPETKGKTLDEVQAEL
ncbi:facilitated trehalose transporter Tret1-like [Thrips palmi]|uniref:Facilitated trehalose transporter Tret1-like n=1 Tax=Thrips palmi TaxID=161013 RepID=A0A6P8ZZA1_THRPL|nr:facilitated trehalose transporter Tret1-like [Thrips palmi]